MAQAQEAISEGSQERQKVTLDEKKTVKQLGRNLFDVLRGN